MCVTFYVSFFCICDIVQRRNLVISSWGMELATADSSGSRQIVVVVGR